MSLSRVAALGPFTLVLGLSAACGSSTITHQGAPRARAARPRRRPAARRRPPPRRPWAAVEPAAGRACPGTTYPGPFPAPPQVVNAGGPVLCRRRSCPVLFMDDDRRAWSRRSRTSSPRSARRSTGRRPSPSTASARHRLVARPAHGPAAPRAPSPTRTSRPGSRASSTATIRPGPRRTTTPSMRSSSAGHDHHVERDGTSCKSFGGYHDNITLDANHGTINVAYAVIPRCGGDVGSGRRRRRGAAPTSPGSWASTR